MAGKKWNMASYPEMRQLQSEIKKDIQSEIVPFLIEVYSYIGEACVKIARDKARENTWGDVTGNLRSSIGYVIQNNGIPVLTGPSKTFAGKDGKGEDGPREAKELMKSLRGMKQSGVVLIVVAGMDYAEYVERIHGKDVLASAWLEGERLADKLLGKMCKRKTKVSTI